MALATEGLKRTVRKVYSGASWQSPPVRAAMPIVDRLDARACRRNGHGHIPPYSARIRSSGMAEEFGGAKFTTTGEGLKQNLIKHAGLKPTHRVLEVGCGAGRTATALVGYLQPGALTGFDIDEPSIEACQKNRHLSQFTFFHADLDNGMYRPDAAGRTAEYRFPLDDNAFDLVFLASVFTHLLEDDCANYAREIMRVLKPGGVCAVSTFLWSGAAVPGEAHDFPHAVGAARVQYAEQPTKIVAYEPAMFDQWFGVAAEPLRGRWHKDGVPQIDEWQDWVIVRKH